MEVASPDLLASEIVALVEEREPAAVLVGALAGAGHSRHLRYLCKRLRARFPDLPIVLGWWGADADAAARTEMLEAGADRLAVTLGEADGQLQELVRLERPPIAAAHSTPAGHAMPVS